MSTITTRSGKGTALTHNEMDNNFTNLNTDKYESGDSMVANTVTAISFVKDGGSSSEFLMADGSVTTSSGGATVDDATALAIALG